MPIRRRPEQSLQRAVIDLIATTAHPYAFTFHVPNGGWRRPTEAKIMKGLGVVPGVPDLIILFGGRAFGLELKAPRGRMSDDQIEVHCWMKRAGAEVATVSSLAQALDVLVGWGVIPAGRVKMVA
jgi:hypothetical protein